MLNNQHRPVRCSRTPRRVRHAMSSNRRVRMLIEYLEFSLATYDDELIFRCVRHGLALFEERFGRRPEFANLMFGPSVDRENEVSDLADYLLYVGDALRDAGVQEAYIHAFLYSGCLPTLGTLPLVLDDGLEYWFDAIEQFHSR